MFVRNSEIERIANFLLIVQPSKHAFFSLNAQQCQKVCACSLHRGLTASRIKLRVGLAIGCDIIMVNPLMDFVLEKSPIEDYVLNLDIISQESGRCRYRR